MEEVYNKTLNYAKQVADLLNIGNQFGIKFNTHHIINNNVYYYIKLIKNSTQDSTQDRIVGVIGVERKTNMITEIKHLCVDPSVRGEGLGTFLLNKGFEKATTPITYGLVRETNFVNIYNNLKLGFKPIGYCNGLKCRLIIFTKNK